MISYRNYLLLTTFVCGSIIMVVELLGSRVIGPPFGVSLFVWTSLITVALVALAFGYWVGGRVADIKDNPTALFSLIIASGLYLLLIPVLKGVIIGWSLHLGLRAGSLVSSALLFGPPLLLLGMVSPYIVKLYLRERDGLGKTVGGLYAISTTGSFIGTISTGFILIPALGVNNIIYLSSLLLILVSVGYFIFFRKKYLVLSLAFIPIALMLLPERQAVVVRPDGSKVEVIEQRDSFYGQIKVVDYSYGELRHRAFLIDNIFQGGIDVNSGLSLMEFSYYIEYLARAYKRDAANALIIGLGGGIVPTRFKEHYDIDCDVVEIDPMVVDTAARHFFFEPDKFNVYAEDGRYFLQRSKTPYDIIVFDTFSGDVQPSHLMSREVFEIVKSKLKKDGVLLINYVGSNVEEEKIVPKSFYRTLKAVFPYVDIYPQSGYFQKEPTALNYIFVAYSKEVEMPKAPAITAPIHRSVEKAVLSILSRKITLEEGPFILSDNYNPIDFYDRKARERFRGNAIGGSEWEIVVN